MAVLLALAVAGCSAPPAPEESPIGWAPQPIEPLLSLEGCEVAMVSQQLPSAAVQAVLPANYTLTQQAPFTAVATRFATCGRGSTEDHTLEAAAMVVTLVSIQPPPGADPAADHRYALDLAVDPPALADWFAAQGIRVRPGGVLRTAGPPEAFAHTSDLASYTATVAPVPGPLYPTGTSSFLLHLPSDLPGRQGVMAVRQADEGRLAAATLDVERGPLADLGSLPLSPAQAGRFVSDEGWTPT